MSPAATAEFSVTSCIERCGIEVQAYVGEATTSGKGISVSSMESGVLCDKACNTELSGLNMEQIKTIELLSTLQIKFKAISIELNEEKSKRMVNDNLLVILQSDISNLQLKNVMEATKRLKLESEITELKV